MDGNPSRKRTQKGKPRSATPQPNTRAGTSSLLTIRLREIQSCWIGLELSLGAFTILASSIKFVGKLRTVQDPLTRDQVT